MSFSFSFCSPLRSSERCAFSAHPQRQLRNITQEAGITWQHFSGESLDNFFIETMGGGGAFLDFDGDGLLDIFFVNAGETPHGKSLAPVRNALYHNLGNGRFEDVAAKAGVANFENMKEIAGPTFLSTYLGRGLAVGDIDNDGDLDVVFTTLNGPPVLLRNNIGQDNGWIGLSL